MFLVFDLEIQEAGPECGEASSSPHCVIGHLPQLLRSEPASTNIEIAIPIIWFL